jgi:hypothetical protein
MSAGVPVNHPLKLPKELVYLFDEAPLVGGERREDYTELLQAIAKAMQPVDFIGWQCVGHITDLSWSIRRERRVKNEIVKHYEKDDFGNAMIMARVGDAHGRDPRYQADYHGEKKQTRSSALAAAFMRGASDIDAIDRRIAAYEARIIMILREARLYTDALIRRIEQARSYDIDRQLPLAAE